MNKYKVLISPKILSLTLLGAIAVAASPGQSARAASLSRVQSQSLPTGQLVGINFQPPGDAAPNNTVPGGTRGGPNSRPRTGASNNIRFQPPGDAAPNNTVPGGTRGGSSFRSRTGASDHLRFEPPGDATPANTLPGGTRGDRINKLIPLIPDGNYGRTAVPRPAFFVYVPPTSATQVFFSLLDEQGNSHYYTNLDISGSGGVVSVTLPADAPELEIDKNYQWFFMTIKPGSRLGPDTYGVSGWVKRVEPPTENSGDSSLTHLERASLYASSGIWYDTLKILAAEQLAQPDNEALAGEWQGLLQQVGLSAIAAEPLAEQL